MGETSKQTITGRIVHVDDVRLHLDRHRAQPAGIDDVFCLSAMGGQMDLNSGINGVTTHRVN
ncbi:hypothetical protein HMPREF9622_02818 [Cutibacterium modestum HL037PA3]|uniref:Uncharacterized protein n=1 Tax=Cutibacterium modestum HL044PA1 TaxID=765109 RepID=A0ABP2K576_9ACTN|nr:hypothetical protein HMPREF9621_02625 [Cutibacterium modestum HL037PA2]EFS92084.1 hypothetical protein HMPREF9607_01712 [Cutibacterium modestum HL044PA1]EFT14181.1 hypothetical protein HMPREF9622_02818 [Cutibacterium modestum HL037PA3]